MMSETKIKYKRMVYTPPPLPNYKSNVRNIKTPQLVAAEREIDRALTLLDWAWSQEIYWEAWQNPEVLITCLCSNLANIK